MVVNRIYYYFIADVGVSSGVPLTVSIKFKQNMSDKHFMFRNVPPLPASICNSNVSMQLYIENTIIINPRCAYESLAFS